LLICMAGGIVARRVSAENTRRSVVETVLGDVGHRRFVFYPNKPAGLASEEHTRGQLRNDRHGVLVAHGTPMDGDVFWLMPIGRREDGHAAIEGLISRRDAVGTTKKTWKKASRRWRCLVGTRELSVRKWLFRVAMVPGVQRTLGTRFGRALWQR
jgi:hypothetical protein